MSREIRLIILLVFAGIMFGVGFNVQAQDTSSDTCRQIQQIALESIDAQCSDLEGNIACYGYTNVAARDVVGIEDFFSTAGERRALEEFVEIQTLYNPDLLEWGVAVMSLAVDPTTNIELLITGDAQLENVDAAAANTFFFSTTESDCLEVPSAVTIRTPENIRVTFTINGAQIEVGSTVMLRTLPPGNVFQLYTVEGNATLIDPLTGVRTSVLAGQTSERCLSQPQNLGDDGEADDLIVYDSCGWTAPVPATAEELALGRSITQVFTVIDTPFAPQDPVITAVPTVNANACPPGFNTFTHVVQRGENLFRIARRYGKSYVDIARDNGIANPAVLSSGTVLNIFCGRETGQSSFAPATPIPPRPPGLTASIISCNVLNTGTATVTFSWSGADATGISVVTSSSSEPFAGASGTGTISIDLSPNPTMTISSPGRSPFALAITCNQPPFTASAVNCVTSGQGIFEQVRVSWSGAGSSGVTFSGNSVNSAQGLANTVSGEITLLTYGYYAPPGSAGDVSEQAAVVQVGPLFPIVVTSVDTGQQIVLNSCVRISGGA